jgi:hypothetical protein
MTDWFIDPLLAYAWEAMWSSQPSLVASLVFASVVVVVFVVVFYLCALGLWVFRYLWRSA